VSILRTWNRTRAISEQPHGVTGTIGKFSGIGNAYCGGFDSRQGHDIPAAQLRCFCERKKLPVAESVFPADFDPIVYMYSI
jgi:hypothetical protein